MRNINKTGELSLGYIKKCCLLILFIFSVGLCNSQELIPWESRKKLEWKDFKAKPKSSSPFFAETDWSIKYTCNLENGNLVFEVTCWFNPYLSWVKPEGEIPHLLAHEQAHFDIAEIFTRKLRKELSTFDYSKNTIQSSVQKMYYKAFNDCKKMQHKYDEETHHSVQKIAQKIWEERITTLLKSLEEYSGKDYQVPYPG